MTREEPTAQQSGRSARLTAALWALCAVISVAVGATFYALRPENGQAEQNEEILASLSVIATVSTVLLGALLSWREARGERQNVESSRERLADAEERLVGSLTEQATNAHRSEGPMFPEGEGPRSGVEEDERRPVSRPAGANLALPHLWEATHARLKLYHDVALGQANRSFRSAHAAMWLGFLALALFVAVAFNASTTAGSIVAGGLGAVAAGLAGFIGRTFVRSQEHAAEHLRSYFDQPLEMARYLAAERLVADANLPDEQRAEVLAAIVTAMVAGPQPQPSGDAQQPVQTVPQQTQAR
ncbi:hypothetical protein [Streptomyces niveus]|uniref:hypothetical protein n=1 Tax=Streptomyces niveus TaxID=193462 RepID=UPI00368161E5